MSLHIEVTVKKIEPRTVAYVGAKGPFSKIPETMGQVVGWIMQKGLPMSGPPVGVYFSNPGQVAEEELLWEIQWPLDGDLELREPDEQGVGVKLVESYEAAATVHKGPYENVGPVYGALVQWIMENGYEFSGAPEEAYLNDPQSVPQEEILTEVRFPVRKK